MLSILIPLAIGIAIQQASAAIASRIILYVKKTGLVNTIIMLVLSLGLYGKGMIESAGSFAIGTQILYLTIGTAASYGFVFGLKQGQRES